MRPKNHEYLFQIRHLINISNISSDRPTGKLKKSDLRAIQQFLFWSLPSAYPNKLHTVMPPYPSQRKNIVGMWSKLVSKM